MNHQDYENQHESPIGEPAPLRPDHPMSSESERIEKLTKLADLRARLAAARALVIDPIGSRSVATLSKLRDILDLDRPFTPPAP